MPSTFDAPEQEPAKEPRDYAKFVWGGVVLLIVAMLGTMVLFSSASKTLDQSRVRISHILFTFDPNDPEDAADALEQAQAVRKRLLAGENFSELAKQYSDDTRTKARGGDVGWNSRGELAEKIEEYVWQAPLNGISEVIPTNFGFHIVTVTDREISEADRYKEELERRVSQ